MKRILTFLLLLVSGLCFAQSPYLGTWSGKLDLGNQYLTIVFNISDDGNGGLACTLDSPDQGAKGVNAIATQTPEGGLEIKVHTIGASFSGLLFNTNIVGTFSQSGYDFPLSLKKGEIKLSRPQTPKAPFPYTEKEVSFKNGKAGATLSGSLTTPDNWNKENDPIVIMITGSGLEDRNEEVFDHKPFLVIADYLARKGIASLRYDDRGFGQSVGGDVSKATTLDFCEDAACGIEFLRSLGCRHIGALGHSEGGCIVMMLQAKGLVEFGVSLAGVGTRADEALTAQYNRVMELSGTEQKLSVEQYRAMVLSQGNAWLSWFINYDPSQDIQKITTPLFAVNGDKDVQVVSSLNLPAIKKNLNGCGKDFIKEYPGLNHLFQHCRTGLPGEYRQIEETFSEEVLEDMANWILKLR